jgi:GAF domain-containing protein
VPSRSKNIYTSFFISFRDNTAPVFLARNRADSHFIHAASLILEIHLLTPMTSPETTTSASPIRREAYRETYREVRGRIDALLEGETDWIAAQATVACELHHAFERFHWTGFYRAVAGGEPGAEPESGMLVIGPYQGGHGCLRIAFTRGVCGAAARERRTQLVPDVDAFPGHIACASSTRSEIVVPVLTPSGHLLAVLDVDSDEPDAFDETDQRELEAICGKLGEQFAHAAQT